MIGVCRNRDGTGARRLGQTEVPVGRGSAANRDCLSLLIVKRPVTWPARPSDRGAIFVRVDYLLAAKTSATAAAATASRTIRRVV